MYKNHRGIEQQPAISVNRKTSRFSIVDTYQSTEERKKNLEDYFFLGEKLYGNINNIRIKENTFLSLQFI